MALTGTSPRLCRIEECLLGNVITDAVLRDTGVDIVLQNGGGIRADIDAGAVSLGEVLNVLPFGNLISTFELTGADVLAALENGVSRVQVDADNNPMVDGASGRFLQVAGLRYAYDATQEPGSRIVSAEVMRDGEYAALDMEAVYTVASNDYMRSGGDGLLHPGDERHERLRRRPSAGSGGGGLYRRQQPAQRRARGSDHASSRRINSTAISGSGK